MVDNAQESSDNLVAGDIQGTLNVLKYTKKSNTAYSGKCAGTGYHSVELQGKVYGGQRDCFKRFEFIHREIDFTGLHVLDIGCNAGGMLHPIAHQIKIGVGVDHDYKLINACNRVRSLEKYENLHFYVFDVEVEDPNFLKNFLGNIDVVFLFSICHWIKNWKTLINWIHVNSNVLVIETNGDGQENQRRYIEGKYDTVKKLYDKSIDDPSNHSRKLYVAYK